MQVGVRESEGSEGEGAAGGIQRYIEAGFPDGGFFKGANFVFDERGGVPAGGSPCGACLLCGGPALSYAARSRCSACRMLVLPCAGTSPSSAHCVVWPFPESLPGAVCAEAPMGMSTCLQMLVADPECW